DLSPIVSTRNYSARNRSVAEGHCNPALTAGLRPGRGISQGGELRATAIVAIHWSPSPCRKSNRRSNMKVLMILTSHDELGNTGRKTGFWLEELAAPYYAFKDAGAEIVLASPRGGQPPVDPKSNEPEFQTDDTRRFETDPEATRALANTLKLSEVDQADYDAVFFPGGHGPLWDLTNDRKALSLIEDTLAANKPVALVCHAPGILTNVKGPNGEPIAKGRKVTGFKNSEETA